MTYSKEQIARAEAIADDICKQSDGHWPDVYSGALAAIADTTERAAKLADSGSYNRAHCATPERIAEALRNGEHLK